MLLRRTTELLEACEARQLSNIVHGMAKCQLQLEEADVLFDAVAEAAVSRRLEGFNSQELANMAWAFATAGVHLGKLGVRSSA